MPDVKKIIQIIKRREKLVDDIPAEFISAMETAQASLYAELLDYIKGLTTQGGKIVDLEANLQMAFRLRDQIRTWLRRHGYYQSVTDFGKQYEELLKIAREYYRALDLSGTFTSRDLESLSQIRKSDINFLLQNDERVINITYNNLTSAIYRNKSWKDLAEDLRKLHTDTILPDGRHLNGLLKRYSATYAQTAFAAFDRKIQNVKSAQLGLDHYLFSGAPLKDSRDFCVKRKGKVFTKAEIDAWERQSWKGKAEGRSVWDYLGGWNCIDILTPITADLAEELPGLYS